MTSSRPINGSMYPNDIGMKAFATYGAPCLETLSIFDKVRRISGPPEQGAVSGFRGRRKPAEETCYEQRAPRSENWWEALPFGASIMFFCLPYWVSCSMLVTNRAPAYIVIRYK